MKEFVFLILIGLLTTSLSGQKGVEIGGHIGVAHYYGDLNPKYTLSDPGLSFGLKARRNFNYRTCISAGIDFGRVSGSDADAFNAFESSRNLSFKSNIIDFNFTYEFNFFPYQHGSSEYFYTPYIFAGFSIMKYNPTAELNGESYGLRDLKTEGDFYGLVSGSFAYGVGLKWDLNRDFSLNFNLSGRRLFTDRIDDVSENYPDVSSLGSSPVAAELSNRSPDTGFGRPGTQRGDGRFHDTVFFFNVGIMRYFGKLRCPPISKNLGY